MITIPQLDSWLNHNLGDICLNGFASPTYNHCAHFVSHVLRLDFGYTCRQHSGKKNPGANLRVHEIFSRCQTVDEVLQCSTALTGIIFVSASSSFTMLGNRTQMKNVPKKHVGLLTGGFVWHYSNSRHKVVKQSLSDFLYHYPKQTNALWLGTFPPGSRPLWFGQC